jgi:YjbR
VANALCIVGPPTFRVGSGRGKIFCTTAPDGSSVTLKADPVEREALLAQRNPFYVPPYVGDKGWLGIRSDHPRTDWEEVAELIATSYCGRTEAARCEGHESTAAGRVTPSLRALAARAAPLPEPASVLSDADLTVARDDLRERGPALI